MQWISPFWLMLLSSSSLIVATIALVSSLRLSASMNALSASLAASSTRLSEIERSERLTPSKLAELADVQDAIGKGNALLKRINIREAMRDRKAAQAEGQAFDTGTTKDDLRRKAGLIAGKPAPHS